VMGTIIVEITTALVLLFVAMLTIMTTMSVLTFVKVSEPIIAAMMFSALMLSFVPAPTIAGKMFIVPGPTIVLTIVLALTFSEVLWPKPVEVPEFVLVLIFERVPMPTVVEMAFNV
ncbi:unnamed protein product, partial [Prorocentrum cordatum]